MTESAHMNVIQLLLNDQIREIQTILRDKLTSHGDFVFYADRLIRLVVEEGLNLLPASPKNITTPAGTVYEGVQFNRGNCGVSIVRSGESMERALRECCRSIRIGKILIQSDDDTHEARILYTKLVPDIGRRKVLLLYPIMSSGNTVVKAVRVLKENGVVEPNIIVLNLFCTPKSCAVVGDNFPSIRILTSEIHTSAPVHFGHKYFGTD